jgi:hypothetical protein
VNEGNDRVIELNYGGGYVGYGSVEGAAFWSGSVVRRELREMAAIESSVSGGVEFGKGRGRDAYVG